MADVNDLPEGILRKIAVEHLDDVDDFGAFGGVCRSWRSEIKDVNHRSFYSSKKNTQLPWLLLADPPANNSYRRVYNLSKGMYRKINLPRFDSDPDDHRRYFSSKGWLIAVSRRQTFVTFFDPFSGAVITPPTMPLLEFMYGDEWDDEQYTLQFHRFIFSTCPISSSSDDFQVAMIWDNRQHLALWKPGQQHWIRPHITTSFSNCQIEDVCFFRQLVYCINGFSQLVVFEEDLRPRILADLTPLSIIGPRYYLVVSGTILLVILRKVKISDDYSYFTDWFKLFEVNVDAHDDVKVTQVNGIGNRALFVGYNSTFFVEASSSSSSSRAYKPNCIYFADDSRDFYGDCGGGEDMGIYSLEENKMVAPVYEGPSRLSHETPPLWVELPAHY